MVFFVSYDEGQLDPSARQEIKPLALEGVNVEALVFPRKVSGFKSLFDRIPLSIIRGNDLVLLALPPEYTGEVNDHDYLLVVLTQKT